MLKSEKWFVIHGNISSLIRKTLNTDSLSANAANEFMTLGVFYFEK